MAGEHPLADDIMGSKNLKTELDSIEKDAAQMTKANGRVHHPADACIAPFPSLPRASFSCWPLRLPSLQIWF